MNNHVNRGLSDSEGLSQSLVGQQAGCVAFSDVNNLRDDQFSMRCCFPSTDEFRIKLEATLAFVRGILHIGLLCAKKKMCYIDTWAIITRMANQQSPRNGAIGKLPCYSMGTDKVTQVSEQPVSTTRFCSSPKPTITGFINVFPKTLLDWIGGVRHVQLPQLSILSLYMTGVPLDNGALMVAA